VNEASQVEAGIRTLDRRLRVFVSSTVGEAGELAAERRAVVRAISALRLTPVLFEAGARPYPPRALYRAYLAQSDVFVGLYWERYGRVEPGMEVSGLEEELQLALSEGCHGCCMSRRRPPSGSHAWPSCWPTSSRRPRTPIGTSGPRPSWAGWSVTIWRRW
jgi:Domain of unknown function (DUF4062)